jgi:MFS family permease
VGARGDLRLLVGAVGVSALGDFLALIPLALLLQETTGSGLAVAGLFIALWAPVVVLAGVAGLIVDRVETRALLVAVSLGQAVVALALAFTDSVAAVLLLTGLLGTGFAVAQPAEFALVPAVACEARLTAANARVETARYVGMTLGPLAGGALAAGGGTRLALLVNAASFLAVAAAAGLLRARRRPDPAAAEQGRRERARDGIVFLFGDRSLALVMAVAFASLLFMTASATAEVFFAKEVLDAGDFGYGALMACWMVGMVGGAVLLARRVPAAWLVPGALAAVAVQGAGLATPTVWLLLGFAATAYLVGGAAHGLKNVLIRTLLHERVPDRLRGRAFAAYNGLRNGAELVALAGGGVLVAAIGPRWTLLVAGGGAVVAGLLGLAAHRRAAMTRAGAGAPLEAPAAQRA